MIKLFDYQINWVDKICNFYNNCNDPVKRAFLFLDMGTGKTYTALGILDRLKSDLHKVLIVCPKSLIEMWNDLLTKYFGFNVTVYEKIRNIATKTGFITSKEPFAVCVINYEQFILLNYDVNVDMVIFDEVHKIKNVKGKIHNSISKYVKPRYSLGLTGTPITKDYMDLFGILTCVGPKTWNGLMSMQYKVKYIINGGLTSTYELMQSLLPCSVMGNLEDFVKLQGYDNVVIPVKLSQMQYAQLDIIYHSDLSALARIVEAQKITSGIEVNCGKRKLCEQLIDDIISDNEKVVLFTKFTSEFEYFMNRYSGICTGINGAVTERAEAVRKFQTDDNIKIFVGNLQAASLGLGLFAANKCIFYSETHSWGDMIQAMKRIYRTGQTRHCIYYHLLARDSIDELIYQSNINKSNLIEEFKRIYGGD